MLYVFHVDAGTMMTFDMSLAIDSVSNLKHYIERECGIPPDKQVLLASGGECLEPNARVCSYSAGTDTSPIFLFSKAVIESKTPPCPSIDCGSDIDLSEKVKELQGLPATINTVIQRTQLAHKFHELAKEQTRICEHLVHDQHLQQQGWAAVVANLEDITAEFKKRAAIFEKSFSEFVNERETYLKFLQHFNEDLQTLAMIPVLPQLLEIQTVKEEAENVENENREAKSTTLLEWISAADSKSSMDQLFEHCSKGLEMFNDSVFSSLHNEVETAIVTSENPSMKEVKGLGDRLYGLEQLMCEAKRCVQAQADLAQSLQQNQNRASNLGDPSVLPDLCASHRKQLQVMLQNHQQLQDIRRRCTRAKEELSINLYHRLKWVMYVENMMLETDQKLMVYHESLRKLRGILEVLQQIHLAPATYLSAVAEVVRRKAFSQAFLSWASELACHLLTIHNEEVARRKDFQSQFEGHFLNLLFPGMGDLPPPYATQAPSIFDSNLPKLTVEDVEYLKQKLPDLSENLNVPDISTITNFFVMKSIVKAELDKTDADDRGIEEKLVQVVTEVGLASNLDHNMLKPAESEICLAPHVIPLLKDLDKGCESETDTEEFEKVGQSPLELHSEKDLPSTRPKTQDMATLTEVGEKNFLPPRKPPRTFQKIHQNSQSSETCSSVSHSSNMGYSLMNINPNASLQLQRTLSSSGSHSNTESFANIKNPSLESIDELGSLKNFNSNTESCFNSHHQQMQSLACGSTAPPPKSVSPLALQSPKTEQLSPVSPIQAQPANEFITDEYYIDESLPSSLSIETGHSQGEFVRQLDTANNVVALLQDNLQTSRTEQDKLRSVLIKMSDLANQALHQIRLELNELRTFFLTKREGIESQYNIISNSWETLLIENENRRKEALQRLSVDHELELNDHIKATESKNEEIRNLHAEILTLESSLKGANEKTIRVEKEMEETKEKMTKELHELLAKVDELKNEKEKSVKEVSEKLIREHKAEIDNIRSRFRLMATTKMDRSPSETNYEGFDVKDSISSEALILQVKENYELDKEKAIKEAVAQEAQKWEKILNEKIQELVKQHELEKETLLHEVSGKISEEKDRLIDILQKREENLSLECSKYKSTIQQLAESGTESLNSELLEKIDTLEKEKERLEMELCLEKSKKTDEGIQDMGTSVSVVEGKVDAATSPVSKIKGKIMSQSSLIRSGNLNIESCTIGDTVLVLWDPTHESYIILQKSSYMYFLHSDSVEALDLVMLPGGTRKIYCVGEVIDKEYCHAKKAENRYKVPKGTKFYRVKVKKLSKSHGASKICEQIASMSQSQTLEHSAPSADLQASSSTLYSSLPSASVNLQKTFEEESEKVDGEAPEEKECQKELEGPQKSEKSSNEESSTPR